MSGHGKLQTCAEIAPLLVFYACNEVDAPERAAIEAHMAACTDCRAQFEEEQEFQKVIGSLPQAADQVDTTGVLLSQLRSELAEKLDDLETPPVKERPPVFAWLRHWMALHPAWSGALLVLFGLLAGVQTTQWFTGSNDARGLDVSVRPDTRITQDQLRKMEVSGVNVNMTPSTGPGTENVRLQLSAEQPVVLTGTLDDKDVRQVLSYVVENGERFDSGVRLDCLEALKARAQDQEVRQAMLAAAIRDRNPAVRLKALESLKDSTSDSAVRETLLQALQQDSNPGVRVEAVNLLVSSLKMAGPQVPPMPKAPPETLNTRVHGALPDGSLENVIRALEELQHRDPNPYVRLRSAAALREISARNEQ